MSAAAQELQVKQDDIGAALPEGSPEIMIDDADDVMAGFGFMSDIAAEVPKAKKRKTNETQSPDKPGADAEKIEGGDADAAVTHTKESLGFCPSKKCRLPKCVLMKKVGQPTCGPHRKQKEAVRFASEFRCMLFVA